MVEDGYLESKKRAERGRVKICFKATSKGSFALKQVKPKINELVSEVLM